MMNHGCTYPTHIGGDGDGETVEKYLARRFPHDTLDGWEERLRNGEVTDEADRPLALGTRLRAGQELFWHRPPWDEPGAPTVFRVIAEDADFLAVDKPEGLPTLPGAGFLENTLLFRVRERFPEAVPMHRLGRGTTGIVLFARTQEARQVIQREWQAGRVSKTYLAVTSGIVPEKADIDVPIGLVPHPILGRIHAASKAGKPSQSHLRRLCVLSPAACRTQQSQSPSPMSLAEVKIDTGRPHQIRIHTAAIGHPLWGDPLYLPGGLPAPDSRNVPGDTGYLLHAFRLAFRHPATGKDVELTVPPPLPRWEAVRLVMPELWKSSETI